jgi:hypothetical protein
MRARHNILLSLSLAACFALSACGGEDDEQATPPSPTPSEVTTTKPSSEPVPTSDPPPPPAFITDPAGTVTVDLADDNGSTATVEIVMSRAGLLDEEVLSIAQSASCDQLQSDFPTATETADAVRLSVTATGDSGSRIALRVEDAPHIPPLFFSASGTGFDDAPIPTCSGVGPNAFFDSTSQNDMVLVFQDEYSPESPDGYGSVAASSLQVGPGELNGLQVTSCSSSELDVEATTSGRLENICAIQFPQ